MTIAKWMVGDELQLAPAVITTVIYSSLELTLQTTTNGTGCATA